MPTKALRDIIARRALHCATPQDSLRTACHVLNDHDIGALAVVSDGRLVGILSERDVIRRAVCGNRSLDETRVAEIMTVDPETADIDSSPAEALALMQAGGFRHLPVTEAGRPIGMISIRDIPLVSRVLLERYAAFRADRGALRPETAA